MALVEERSAAAARQRNALAGLDYCASWPSGHQPPESSVIHRLLGVSAQEFMDGARRQPALSRVDVDAVTKLFSLSSAQELIDSGTLSSDHFDFVQKGDLAKDLSTSRLQGAVARRALSKGYTVLLRGVDLLWPSVRDLAVGLSSEVEEVVHVNSYMTPGDRVALPRHSDNHDVMVVQLHGTKHWRVFGESPEEPQIDTSLRPGDVIYVPRGCEHEVQAESFSLHLTIGFLGPSWQELLTTVLASVVAREADFSGPADSEGASEHAALLAGHPDLEDVARGALALQIARGQTCATSAVDLGASDGEPLALDARLSRTAPLFVAALERDGRPSLIFGGRRVDGPGSLREAFQFIADHDAFRLSELPGSIDETARRDLGRRLMAEGLLADGA